MFLGAEFKVRTPWGVFALVAARSSRGWVGTERRVLSPQEAARVWFFAEGSLERPGGFELAAVRELLREVNGDWLAFRGTTRDGPQLERLREEVAQALRAGRLRFEEVPQHPEPDGRRRIPKLLEPPARTPAPRREPTSFEYSVRLVDENDQGLPGIEVTFSWSPRVESRTTGGTGLARCEVPESSNAKVELVADEALVEALKSRWSSPRLLSRPRWLKAGPKTAVVPFRSARSLPAVEVKPEVPFTISLQPFVELVRLRGAFFDTNKCFLLPTVLPYIRQLKDIYEQHPKSPLVIVGHTDVTGEPNVNDPLSLDRARAFEAFIKDDVDAWLAWFEASKPDGQRWSASEDKLMLRSLPDYPQKPRDEDRVRWFQRTRGLSVDGIAGPITRRALVTEYMGHDGTTLPAGTPTFVHGCGENFPMPEPPPREQAASDRHSDIEHRRVEIFLFDPKLGVQPPLPGEISAPGSLDYPAWFARSAVITDLRAEGVSKEVTVLEMHDALFRTNSCVLMPEGEDPMTRPAPGAVGAAQSGTGAHLSLTSVGLVASVLRYNEEHPGKKLLIAGHCDTTASVEFNQKLSNERADMALARLTGDREAFKTLADGRYKVADYKQILSWVSLGLDPEALEVPFDCEPRTIDDNAGTDIDRVKAFQGQYNQNKAALDASGPDLKVDGDVGPLTWGAFFDCYEFALREELGEEASGVQALRDQLVWVDDSRKALGFSEHHPVDNLGRDGYRSQANRRVEVLFFDEGEEPDLELAASNPEGSELYLPGHYQREHLEAMGTAKRVVYCVRLLGNELKPCPNVDCTVEWNSGFKETTSNGDGLVYFAAPPDLDTCNVNWQPSNDATTRIQREILFSASSLSDLRLNNLGYEQDNPLDAFRQEFGYDDSVPNDELSEHVAKWHDEGQKPTAGSEVEA